MVYFSGGALRLSKDTLSLWIILRGKICPLHRPSASRSLIGFLFFFTRARVFFFFLVKFTTVSTVAMKDTVDGRTDTMTITFVYRTVIVGGCCTRIVTWNLMEFVLNNTNEGDYQIIINRTLACIMYLLLYTVFTQRYISSLNYKRFFVTYTYFY